MLWRCPACNRQTEEPVCSRCQTPMEAGEPSAATGLLKETAGSVLFLIAVIAFTAALVFSIVSGFFVHETIGMKDIKEAVTLFSDATGTKMTAEAWKGIHTLFNEFNEQVDVQSGELPLVNILACVGLWLVLAQGYTNRVNFRKGGPIVLKVATVLCEVGAIVVTICGGLLGAGLWLGRPELVATFGENEDAIAVAIHDLLACETTMWILLGLCGVMVVFGLLYTVFFICATKSVNRVLYTAKTGDFGKRVSAFVGVALCVAAVALAADAVGSLLTANVAGIGSALYAVAYLLFAIVLFCYRHRAYTLSWEQPAFTGETAAPMPGIPTGIKASDLMNERPAAPTAAMPQPTARPQGVQNPQAPRRTLNEPFREESLEPKPMTGNGCCPKCGTPIPDNAFFCLSCGHKFR